MGNTRQPRSATLNGGARPRFRVSRMSERQLPHEETAVGHAPEARTGLDEFRRTFRTVARTAAKCLENSEKKQARPVVICQRAQRKGRKSGVAGHRAAAASGVLSVALVAGAWSTVVLCRVRLLQRNRRDTTVPVDETHLVIRRHDRRRHRRRKLRLPATGAVIIVRRRRTDGQKESHRGERQGSQQPGNGMGSMHRPKNESALLLCQ